MPSPSPDWTTVTVAGKYKDYEGNPVAGRVIFTPTAERAVDADQLVMIVGRPISVAINESTGIASIALPATDDPDITPINFTYTVTEDFEFGQTYSIAVPMAKAGTGLDLATVAPQATSEGIPLYYMETLDARDLAQGYAQQAAGSVSLVAWAPNTVYVAGNIRQAPDGSGIRRNANGTSRATFDATEQAAWTAIVGVTGTMEQLAADARYLNMGETITDAELPGRLKANPLVITDANTAIDNGWYRIASTGANIPDVNGYIIEAKATNDPAYVTQIAYAYAVDGSSDTKTWRREKNSNVWGSWYRIRQSEEELDARYMNVGEAVADTQLPARLRQSAMQVTDWNTADADGFYWSDNVAANAPVGQYLVGWMVAPSVGFSGVQTVIAYANTSSTDSKIWRRYRSGGTWTAWSKVRESETELDARYSPLTYTAEKLVADLPATYQLGVSMFAVETLAAWPGGYGSVLTAMRSNTRGFQIYTEATTGAAWIRTAHTNFGSGWSPWTQFGGDSGWIAPTLLNSWVNSGAPYNNVGYRKIGNRVFLRGTLKGGTLTTVAFTLPVGYRPTAQFNAPTVTNGGFGFAILNSAGNVNPYAGNSPTDFVLDGISFLVD